MVNQWKVFLKRKISLITYKYIVQKEKYVKLLFQNLLTLFECLIILHKRYSRHNEHCNHSICSLIRHLLNRARVYVCLCACVCVCGSAEKNTFITVLARVMHFAILDVTKINITINFLCTFHSFVYTHNFIIYIYNNGRVIKIARKFTETCQVYTTALYADKIYIIRCIHAPRRHNGDE